MDDYDKIDDRAVPIHKNLQKKGGTHGYPVKKNGETVAYSSGHPNPNQKVFAIKTNNELILLEAKKKK